MAKLKNLEEVAYDKRVSHLTRSVCPDTRYGFKYFARN
jgi:hypothetical protein